MDIKIITHRGLDPSREHYFAESSLEAFTDQLRRGFGLEFDLQKTKEGSLVVSHDRDLARISGGRDRRIIRDMTKEEVLAVDFGGCHLSDLETLSGLISKHQSDGQLSAVHLKSVLQNKDSLDAVLHDMRMIDPEKYMIFDVQINAARYLKNHNSSLQLAPSVADPYDIQRYNGAVGGTLYSIGEILPLRDLFGWVWLDEWDLTSFNNEEKSLYCEETFTVLRKNNFLIAIVSPELHANSPGLLGGEMHPDASNSIRLKARMKRIFALLPDAVCTDYPDMMRELAITGSLY